MLRYYEPELADDAGDYVTILGFACKRGDGLKASRYTKPCRVFSACGGAALYRKSILDEIGVFDELFFAYYEDVDLSWRANNFGYRNVYCPTARCRHICGATTGAVRYNPFKSIQSGRNSILLPYKNQPLLMLVLNFIPMLLGYLLKVLMFRLRGFGGDYAKGFREAWAALPKITTEIQVAEPAQLCLGGVQSDRRAVQVHCVPRAAGVEDHVMEGLAFTL